MAFSFKNIINKIKEQFKPPSYFNVDTGEIIKKRIYKQLDEREKSSYIPSVKFDEITKQPKITKPEIKEPSKQKPVQPKQTKPAIEKEETIKSIKIKKNKKGRKKGSKNKPKEKTYEDVKPPKPPKEIEKHIETQREDLIPTISSVDELKARLQEIERKIHPVMDLSSTREFFLSIVEENETYYEEENANPYIDYLIQNSEQIAEAIYSVEYLGSTQEDVQGYISSLAYLLNMGALTPMQAEQLADITESGMWYDINE